MIRNPSKQEWDALTSAVVLQEAEWQQNAQPGMSQRQIEARLAALNRAYEKARQLAPEALDI